MNWLNLAIHKMKYKSLYGDDPRLVAGYRFRKVFGRSINWDDPKDLNEKIQWLKFYSDTSSWTQLADKWAVRDYVAERGFGDTLVKLYDRWERTEEINWESLPEQFVMKINNGCHDILICRDKSQLDRKKITRQFARLLRKSYTYGYVSAEPHYATIKPCIIAEELLDHTQQSVESSTLVDYKIWCIHGEPHFLLVHRNRQRHSVGIAAYDLDWQPRPEWVCGSKKFHIDPTPIPRPATLDRMLEIARALSKGHPQMRVDLYEVGGKIYFGECTMASYSGCINVLTQEFLLELGSRLQLPEKQTK